MWNIGKWSFLFFKELAFGVGEEVTEPSSFPCVLSGPFLPILVIKSCFISPFIFTSTHLLVWWELQHFRVSKSVSTVAVQRRRPSSHPHSVLQGPESRVVKWSSMENWGR